MTRRVSRRAAAVVKVFASICIQHLYSVCCPVGWTAHPTGKNTSLSFPLQDVINATTSCLKSTPRYQVGVKYAHITLVDHTRYELHSNGRPGLGGQQVTRTYHFHITLDPSLHITHYHTFSRSRSTATGVPGGAVLSTSLTRPLPSIVPITCVGQTPGFRSRFMFTRFRVQSRTSAAAIRNQAIAQDKP